MSLAYRSKSKKLDQGSFKSIYSQSPSYDKMQADLDNNSSMKRVLEPFHISNLLPKVERVKSFM
jgi:hypothetical protein